jgi:hypothetical protein
VTVDPENKVSPRRLAEFPIKITGVNQRAVTQYFKLSASNEFAFGAGLRVLIRRKEGYIPESENEFDCLLDQSCQISKRNQKNHVSLNVVLTSGEYLLQFFDDSDPKYA